MMTTRVLIALGAALVLGAVNFSIMGKERIRNAGELVFLDLQPRDPRSLMQGDYMTLRFRLADEIRARGNPLPPEGSSASAGVTLDARGVASLAPAGTPAKLNIRYRIRKGQVWLGTNAFFFEEGSDQRYSGARYGEFRVDAGSGEAVLVGLRDAQLRPL